MSEYETRVAEAVQALDLDSHGAFTWFGQRYTPFRVPRRGTLSPGVARERLLASLRWVLYENFYGRGLASRASRRSPASVASSAGFLETLAFTNSGAGYWQQGWQLLGLRGDEFVLRRQGLTLRARPRDIREDDSTAEKSWSVRQPKGSGNLSPGYYVAFGDVELRDGASEPRIRLYVNVGPEGAVSLIRHVTSLFNARLIPFALKVPRDPAAFDRRDTGVLYVMRADYAAVAAELERICPLLSPGLRSGTPAFTKPIAESIGLAENPPGGESFGLHRCRLLAEGIVRAHEGHWRRLSDRARVVADCFEAAGISLERPYLNPGSDDIYPRLESAARAAIRIAPAIAGAGLPRKDLLQVASSIGERLCREAIWHGDRCTWLGPEVYSAPQAPAAAGLCWKPLGADLYGGTSGVALFLAHLHAITGDGRARDVALGAMRRALAALDTVPVGIRLGLFSGWTGIVLSAMRVGQLLGESELCEAASRLLSDCARETGNSQEFDLLSGRAGALVEMVALAGALEEDSFLQCARRLGDELLVSAISCGSGHAWQSRSRPRERPLTGFSHGAAGVAYALLELSLATGDTRYRQGAEKAFAYERDLFDPAVKNWPDLRDVSRARQSGPLPYMTAWCHGAPGIALSRLRAFRLTNDKEHKAEAIAGLETTRDAIQRSLVDAAGDFSLCHGVTGNADVLLEGQRTLAPWWTDHSSAVMHLAAMGIEAYASRGAPWPCGAGGDEAPGLMLGLAGIGYFYLRLYDPDVPSILLPTGTPPVIG